jgi:hypothetical protein
VKSTTALVKLFKEHGFTLVRQTNHQVWGCPCGHALITIATSPCKGRGDSNAKAQLRRTLRACTTDKDAT